MIVGSKYAATADLHTTDVAKLIRADLRDAQKRGNLPTGITFSVRAGRSGGDVSVVIKGYTGPIENPKLKTDPSIRFKTGWMDPKARKISEAVLAIVEAYNFDGSDITTDYHNVRFSTEVGFAQTPGLICA